MSRDLCPETETLLARLRAGEPEPDPAAHAAGCAACRDALAVAALFAGAAPALAPERLPDPGVLLLRARMRTREAAARRAVRPIVWVERLTAPVVALLAAWGWPWLREGAAGLFAAERWTAPVPGSAVLLLAVVAALVTALVVLDLAGSES
ncbi:MAG: hypothetical protein KJ058_07565 [Thermoanaerobaculia bacterium]|nr:hypothetical protein [Thermoanaerobaculia bacterium]MCZ7652155.1 hypothetical protein [Thermoanaerobaculia bacterium]